MKNKGSRSPVERFDFQMRNLSTLPLEEILGAFLCVLEVLLQLSKQTTINFQKLNDFDTIDFRKSIDFQTIDFHESDFIYDENETIH